MTWINLNWIHYTTSFIFRIMKVEKWILQLLLGPPTSVCSKHSGDSHYYYCCHFTATMIAASITTATTTVTATTATSIATATATTVTVTVAATITAALTASDMGSVSLSVSVSVSISHPFIYLKFLLSFSYLSQINNQESWWLRVLRSDSCWRGCDLAIYF